MILDILKWWKDSRRPFDPKEIGFKVEGSGAFGNGKGSMIEHSMIEMDEPVQFHNWKTQQHFILRQGWPNHADGLVVARLMGMWK